VRIEPRPRVTETKLSFLSTEFWAAVGGVAALIVVYNVSSDPSLSLWAASLLCALLAMAYIVSRGLAKSGSQRIRRWETDGRDGRGSYS
jgi:membrane protein YdbS with pleckstrin-like domain